ncbi:MAG: hypothetical protein ACOCQV_03515 [Halolamina sp.]
MNHWSLLLVAVGVVLATVGGHFRSGAYVCSITEMVSVEPTTTEDEPVPFDSLSRAPAGCFLRALESDDYLTVDDGLDLPYTVSSENETYSVITAHGEGCWITGVPAVPVTLLGLILVGDGGRRLLSE